MTTTENKLRFDETDNVKQIVFQAQRIYIKEQSIELPYAPGLFKTEWKPEVTNELRVESNPLGEGLYDISIKLSATLKNQQVTAATIKVHQAAIFLIQHATPEQLDYLLNANCLTLLYPYAARAINSLMTDATLPPLTLAPINFDVLYQQKKAQEAEQKLKADVHPMPETIQ